jgi:hypothetical protein
MSVMSLILLFSAFPHSRGLRGVEPNTSQATSRFNREIANIFEHVSDFCPACLTHFITQCQCERLSYETGCWLFIGAQHPHANKPFVHYSSDRLCREASQEITEFASKFSVLCASLVASWRQDALAMAQQLAVSEQEREVAEDALRQQKDILEEKDALLAHYRALLVEQGLCSP